MDALVRELESKLQNCKPDTAGEWPKSANLADHDALDLVGSRAVEQDVLDMLDDSASR